MSRSCFLSSLCGWCWTVRTACWSSARTSTSSVRRWAGVRDRGAGQAGSGAAVGHGESQSFGGLGASQVTEKVAEEAGVAGADRADHGGRRGSGVPGAGGGDEHGARAAERGEHRLDAPLDEHARRPRRRRPGRPRWPRRPRRSGTPAPRRWASSACGAPQLEAVGQRHERSPGGVHRDGPPVPARAPTSSAYQPSGAPGRQRPGEHHPAGVPGALGDRGGEPVQVGGGRPSAPGVLILVVVPSGSVSVRLTRTSPAGVSGRQSMPSRSRSSDERVVLQRRQHGDRAARPRRRRPARC